MATRAEQFRANEQRHGLDAAGERRRASRGKPGVRPEDRSRDKKHAEKKATYALEVAQGTGRRSRKSTRKSANRAKPDTNFNLREMLQKGSPEARSRRAQAQAKRVRGSQPAR